MSAASTPVRHRLSRRRLNRTLLARQHLLERTVGSVADEVGHLVGLQAQDTLPPYLAIAARLETIDPREVTRALVDRSLVRLLTLRGTVHLLRASDAGPLRAWTQPRMEQELRNSAVVGPAPGVDRTAYDEALAVALEAGPLPLPALGARLAQTFPDVAPTALGNLARVAAPLVQVPPRGCWRQSGGVVYDHVDRWTGQPTTPLDVPHLVRRYLRAFGPASAADVTAWSGITRLGPVLAGMAGTDDLVTHDDERDRTLYDVPGATLAEEDAPAPVRLLGCYDNLFLSHAARDRVTEPERRAAWQGPNGGTAHTVFVDGWLEGLWRVVDGRVEVVELLRPLTRTERADLDDEITRVDALLAVPPTTGD